MICQLCKDSFCRITGLLSIWSRRNIFKIPCLILKHLESWRKSLCRSFHFVTYRKWWFVTPQCWSALCCEVMGLGVFYGGRGGLVSWGFFCCIFSLIFFFGLVFVGVFLVVVMVVVWGFLFSWLGGCFFVGFFGVFLLFNL